MELTVPKWVLINRPKVPQMPQNLFDQIVCSSPKGWYFDEKRAKVPLGVRSPWWRITFLNTALWVRTNGQQTNKTAVCCLLICI